MTLGYVLIRPSLFIMTNKGINVTCVGIIIDARKSLKMISAYGNFILVIANAAIEAHKIVITVYAIVIPKLFIIACTSGNLVKTVLYEFNVGFCGIHSIGICIMAPLLFSDVDTIQKKGMTTMSAIPNVSR